MSKSSFNNGLKLIVYEDHSSHKEEQFARFTDCYLWVFKLKSRSRAKEKQERAGAS